MVSSTGLDEATDVLDLLPPPPLPKPGPGRDPLARGGHPGGPGFTAPDAPATDSVWQRAQAAWLAVGAEWSGAGPAPGNPASFRSRPRLRPEPRSALVRRRRGPRADRWSGRTRQFLLVAVAVVLVLAVAGGGYAWDRTGRLGPRGHPARTTRPV